MTSDVGGRGREGAPNLTREMAVVLTSNRHGGIKNPESRRHPLMDPGSDGLLKVA